MNYSLSAGVRDSIRVYFVTKRGLYTRQTFVISLRLIHRVTFIKLKTRIKHVKRSMNLKLKDIFVFLFPPPPISVCPFGDVFHPWVTTSVVFFAFSSVNVFVYISSSVRVTWRETNGSSWRHAPPLRPVSTVTRVVILSWGAGSQIYSRSKRFRINYVHSLNFFRQITNKNKLRKKNWNVESHLERPKALFIILNIIFCKLIYFWWKFCGWPIKI